MSGQRVFERAMIATAPIATTIQRARDHSLPGREAVDVSEVHWAAWRMMSAGAERRDVRDRHRRRDVAGVDQRQRSLRSSPHQHACFL
jgi:hypothetical protein